MACLSKLHLRSNALLSRQKVVRNHRAFVHISELLLMNQMEVAAFIDGNRFPELVVWHVLFRFLGLGRPRVAIGLLPLKQVRSTLPQVRPPPQRYLLVDVLHVVLLNNLFYIFFLLLLS